MAVAVGAPNPPANTSESALTALGDKYLLGRGYTIAPAASKALNPASGYPQRIYMKPGHMLVVEYLKKGAKLSEAQEQWADVIQAIATGSNEKVDYLMVTPENWHELRKAAQ